ncbi:DUF4839 domain-containing protein [Pseudoclavibacter sp. Z016]|uniref:DUF4839 domain-containing protein n=1 Tax=Pseudoclavibacter sp. Z016 TaxID=2080581 RepID=UPI0015E2E6D8|nr:DUF4839 domain-containing protein [Pseudoclavibacter sp. Z016]
MADGQPQYEIKVVQAIRGTEARTIAKWQRDGWEVTGQVPGTLRTEIAMRRPKVKLPVRAFAIAGGVAVAVVAAVVLGITFGSDGDEAASVAETSTATATAIATETSAPVAEEPARSTEAAPVALTPETNTDLTALLALTDSCAPEVAAFAERYKGQTLSFPASIGAMNKHGSYDTRYDILINAGDFSETSALGPAFQFRDKNTVSDLKFVGPIRDTIGVGDNLSVTAKVLEYEESTCLFLLEPVETSFR